MCPVQSERERVANDTIEDIALKHLRLRTLEARNADALDFHELSEWRIREALEAAYMAGAQSGLADSDTQHRSAGSATR